MTPQSKIVLALDTHDVSTALLAIEQTAEHVGYFKVGLELICSMNGWKIMEWIKVFKSKIFYDVKLHDIPNTVGRAVASVCDKVDLINVHASAGIDAMKAAVANAGNCKVLAVTVLTSMQKQDLDLIGFQADASVEDVVRNMAHMAKSAGVHGLICSPLELEMLKREGLADGFLKVIPGIRPTWAVANDQKRVMTPADAVQAGADLIVIGRPVMSPPDGFTRESAVKKIVDEIAQAM